MERAQISAGERITDPTPVTSIHSFADSIDVLRHPSFIDAIANLQRDRQIRASYQPDEVQFHDRCAVCTAALAVYLGRPLSPFLASELERVKKEAIYQNRVFFIRNLGFITPTEARRISFEETVRFEKIHEETYVISLF